MAKITVYISKGTKLVAFQPALDLPLLEDAYSLLVGTYILMDEADGTKLTTEFDLKDNDNNCLLKGETSLSEKSNKLYVSINVKSDVLGDLVVNDIYMADI